ncbi:MAG: ABC transporter substrate-binding protein [Oscillospiraceae bacterium]|nr:ABC transporter substrate-binding protein [Oscillospiraceae bacterium]
MKKFITIALTLMLILVPFAGCGGSAPAPAAPAEPAPAAPAEPAPAAPEAPPADDGEPLFIPVISKGFQHQFWQTVAKGSQDAADKHGVRIDFQGPPSESDIQVQVDMVNAALAQNPAALCLAALDTQSLDSQLNQALSSGIPVVGFDSGVPDAPAGSIVSTASTNNESAGALGAEEMFKEAGIAAKISGATAAAPVVIGVVSQDATSASIVGRTRGFVNKMLELAEGVHPGGVEVAGHDVFNKAASGDVVVTILVSVPPSPSSADLQAAAQTMLQNTSNLIGVFCSNEGAVGGVLAATNDGTDLDRDNGRYSDLIVVGFDAGSVQKNAVKNQYFYGAITQDPYMIGFLAVELAVKAVNGESVDEIVDTGAKFYSHANMDQPDIAQLLYD